MKSASAAFSISSSTRTSLISATRITAFTAEFYLRQRSPPTEWGTVNGTGEEFAPQMSGERHGTCGTKSLTRSQASQSVRTIGSPTSVDKI